MNVFLWAFQHVFPFSGVNIANECCHNFMFCLGKELTLQWVITQRVVAATSCLATRCRATSCSWNEYSRCNSSSRSELSATRCRATSWSQRVVVSPQYVLLDPLQCSFETSDLVQVIRQHISINVWRFDCSPNNLHWIFQEIKVPIF